jgi:ribonuclease Z
MIKTAFAVTSFLLAAMAAAPARAAPCLIVTLTGTQSGPPADPGLAGAGTLVRYGDDANDCSAVKLQFDSGRGTTMRLSQAGVAPGQLNAIFFTHMHSDHVDGFADIVQLRWHLNPDGPKIDVVCSADAASALGFTVSYKRFIDILAFPICNPEKLPSAIPRTPNVRWPVLLS